MDGSQAHGVGSHLQTGDSGHMSPMARLGMYLTLNVHVLDVDYSLAEFTSFAAVARHLLLNLPYLVLLSFCGRFANTERRDWSLLSGSGTSPPKPQPCVNQLNSLETPEFATLQPYGWSGSAAHLACGSDNYTTHYFITVIYHSQPALNLKILSPTHSHLLRMPFGHLLNRADSGAHYV
jgi:hypothetical protein